MEPIVILVTHASMEQRRTDGGRELRELFVQSGAIGEAQVQSTLPTRAATKDCAGHPAKPAGTRTDLTPAAINRFKARGTRVESTIVAVTIGNDHPLKTIAERWYSNDLGLLLHSSDSDPRFGTASYELTNIVERDPDPRFRLTALFP